MATLAAVPFGVKHYTPSAKAAALAVTTPATIGASKDAAPSMIESKALAVLSLLGGLFAIASLYIVFSCFSEALPSLNLRERLRTLDLTAFSATALVA